MKVLLIGEEKRANELKQKFSDAVQLKMESNAKNAELKSFDLIVDLNFDDNNSNLEFYYDLQDKPIIVGAVKKQLAETVFNFGKKISCRLIGMNTLPTFLNRSKMEFSLLNKEDKKLVDELAKQLKWEYLLVDDRVGMVTPRIIFMIINEACYTLQEGTASIRDIDFGMKLGTNYPYGPFEWADRIGIKEVYETLLAIYNDTKDERYKISPLLKTKYLKNEKFH